MKNVIVPFLLLAFGVIGAWSQFSDRNPYRHIYQLHPRFHVDWTADYSMRRVTFNVTAQTTGYVAFGLSRKGLMNGSDIVIGGIDGNGRPYFSDRHAKGHSLPEIDPSQDWILHTARENSTHTFLSFSRPFDTCDEEHDIPLIEHGDIVSIIWAIGENDTEFGYHYQFRGAFETYVIDADFIPRELRDAPPFGNYVDGNVSRIGNWNVWTIAKREKLSTKETSYICSFHKAPRSKKKQHIVGFRAIRESVIDVRHIHHFLLHQCFPPPGVDANEFFGPHLGNPGEECYILNTPPEQSRSTLPYQYCRYVNHAWAVGVGSNFLPEHAGIPFTEVEDEYYMLQMHYDNPENRNDLEVKFALEAFYTDELRQYDAGLFYLGTMTPGSPTTFIPPHSIDHINYGHCASGCTNLMFPRQGVNIMSALLHTHLAGTGVNLFHIRDGRHLPWIMYDDNYNFNNQQIRNLNRERTILPGDSIVMKCRYDTTDRGNNVTVGGFSTRSEMCNSFVWYYPFIRSDVYGICASSIESETYNNFIGIHNHTWLDEEREFIVTDPPRNAGLLDSEAGRNINWTTERRRRLQELQRKLPQHSICPSLRVSDPSRIGEADDDNKFISQSPEDFLEYQPPDMCQREAK